MLSYKQPKLWITVASVALVLVVAVCFLTNPVSANEPNDPTTPPNGADTTDTTTEAGADTTELTTTEEPGMADSTPSIDVLEHEYGSLTAEQALRIKQLCLEKRNLQSSYTTDDVYLFALGKYDQAYAVYIVCGTTFMPVTGQETVGGYVFQYPQQTYRIWIYCGNDLYSLTEAYEEGFLSDENLQKLYENYNLERA